MVGVDSSSGLRGLTLSRSGTEADPDPSFVSLLSVVFPEVEIFRFSGILDEDPFPLVMVEKLFCARSEMPRSCDPSTRRSNERPRKSEWTGQELIHGMRVRSAIRMRSDALGCSTATRSYLPLSIFDLPPT